MLANSGTRVLQILLCLCCASLLACRQVVPPPKALDPVPDSRQLQWHHMELNAFIHFTINTFTDKEWGYGNESPALFNPTDFDADQWIRVLKETGFQGVILTCKHHDGFCLWPSKYTERSVKNSPFENGKGDVVKAVADACHKYGLKFGIYVSPWDRSRADYGKPSYITYYRNQLKELFSNYGPIYEMWFDGANGGDGYYGGANEKRQIDRSSYYDWPNTLNLVRSFQPNVLFFSDAGPDLRWCGNEQGHMDTTNWNTITVDTLYAGKPGISNLLGHGEENGKSWVPGEVDTSVRPGWFYHPSENGKVKTPEELWTIYLSSVGRGSTLLLNVPPDRRGRFHDADIASLKGFKAIRDSVFAHDLTVGARVQASEVRGNSDLYGAENLIDHHDSTYWATNDSTRLASVTFTFPGAIVAHYVQLREYIPLGQRIKRFRLEALIDGKWQRQSGGTTIGYNRILKLQPVKTTRWRLSIEDAKACPVISQVSFY